MSIDFHIEADLEMLVMATMAALGEIEIVLNGGTRINASNIATVETLNVITSYSIHYTKLYDIMYEHKKKKLEKSE